MQNLINIRTVTATIFVLVTVSACSHPYKNTVPFQSAQPNLYQHDLELCETVANQTVLSGAEQDQAVGNKPALLLLSTTAGFIAMEVATEEAWKKKAGVRFLECMKVRGHQVDHQAVERMRLEKS